MAKKYNPWTGFLEDTVTKANDEKPTIDKAIHIMDSAKSDAREVYNILAQALQNSTNPNKVSELISKAQGKLLEMAARAKDSKCKTAVDKAIHNCDEEQYYKFILRGGAEYYGTESDMREFFSHLTSKEKKELGTNYKSKTPMSKEEVERWRRNAMNKLGL